MPEADKEVLGWGAIIVAMVVTGFVVGLVLGLGSSLFGLSGRGNAAGVGAAIGVVGALLITRRRAALNAKKRP